MTSLFTGHRVRWLAVAALGAVLAGATGCVSMDEHKRLRTAFDQSQRELAEAQSDLAKLRQKISELEAQIAEKDAALRAGLGPYDALRKERDALLQQLKKLQDQLRELAAQTPMLPKETRNALRDLAAMYPDLLEFDEALGMIRFKSDMTFDLGSTEVKARAKEALRILAGILNRPEIAKNEVRIVGHTDDVPIRNRAGTLNPNNWYLSTNRAHAVLAVLRADGVAESRGQAAGWGEQRPIAPNAPGKRGSEKNRRVEIYILPTEVPEGITISTPGPAVPRTTPRRTTTRPRPTTTAPAEGGPFPVPAG